MDLISYEQFNAVDLRSGTIVDAKDFPEARKPAFLVWVDFGPDLGVLKTSAQITNLYDLEELKGKRVIGCVNLGKRQIGPIISEFLLLGFENKEGYIALSSIDLDVSNGQKLH